MSVPIHYFVDTLCRNFIEGWAISPSGTCAIEVVVDGRVVGTPHTGLLRPDVAAVYPDSPGSRESGFVFGFAEGDLGQADRQPTVWLRIRDRKHTLETERIVLPPAHPKDARVDVRSCLPRRVTEAVISSSPPLARADLTSEPGAIEAINVLTHLVKRGPRPLPGIHGYLGYVRSIFDAAVFAAGYFPRANPRPTGDKDWYGMLTNPYEISSIAHHLYVLDDQQVPGSVLEFGCYKGYSTSVLSHACQRLGRTLSVFDSFEGLPSSTSQYYRPGEFAGDFDEVRQNVAEFGRIDVVEFHKGFFSDTVPALPPRPVMCLWMDVDLEQSAVDALKVFPNLDRRGVLFSHECGEETFRNGSPVPVRGPDDVVGPIVDAFAAESRRPTGVFLLGHTGAFWEEGPGIPVLPHAAFERLVALARQ